MKRLKRTHSFTDKLGSPSYYCDAIERMQQKIHAGNNIMYDITDEGFSFAQIFHDRKKIARLLAKDVSGYYYQFSPATLKTINTAGKKRTIFSYKMMDNIVHSAIYRMIAEDIQPLMQKNIYSYIKGRGRYDAIADFFNFLRVHNKQRKSVKERGFYVYRGDIQSYGESIPVLPSSSLWLQINALFEKLYGTLPTTDEQALLQSIIRPIIINKDGSTYEMLCGIPDGAPISSLLLNLYVSSLDECLSINDGGFYARYGDDILYAHENYDIFMQRVLQINAILTDLGLKENVKKRRCVFYNGAGRTCQNIKGATRVEYLGMSLDFNGTASIKNDKIKMMMTQIDNRIGTLHQLIAERTLEERGPLLCDLIRKIFDPTEPLAHPYAYFLRYLVNDRDQLKQLDYRIARSILKYLTNDSSVKKFRAISYRKMRRSWQLISLVQARNAS